MKSTKKKLSTVFFEDITFWHYPFIRLYLLLGYKIFAFDFKCNLKRRGFLRKLIDEGCVQCIYIDADTKIHSEAIDITEIIFDHLKDNKLVKESQRLYQNDEVAINFKKALVWEVFKCIHINYYLSNMQNLRSTDEGLFFIPVNYSLSKKLISQYSDFCLKPFNRFGVPLRCLFTTPIINLCERLKFYIGSIGYIAFKSLFLICGKLNREKIVSEHYDYAVAIDLFDMQGTFSSDRSANFLLDGQDFSKKNTVFVVNCPLQKEWADFYKKNEYNFIESRKINRPFELAKFNYDGNFVKQLIKAVLGLLGEWRAPLPLLQAFFFNLRIFFDWNVISQRIRFNHYLYSNQESAQQSSRNILIRNNGGQSWSYSFCLGGGYLYANCRKNLKEFRNVYWSFLDFDHYVGMNDIVGEYYKLHKHRVKNYFSIGSIYSEMIKQNMQENSKEDFIKKCFGESFSEGNKLISFFDTTFIDADNCVSTYEDCIEFYQDILKLINMMDSIFVIIKPSKNIEWFIPPQALGASCSRGKRIEQLWRSLQSHEKVFWAFDTSRTEEGRLDFTYNNSIIAFSDLVITHTMSSPTGEALGARKKAIWYKSKKPSYKVLYDDIPGLIVYGYEALEKRIKTLLYDTTDEDYDAYLGKYIKGSVETLLDGQAITKFRKLLKDYGNRQQAETN